MLPAQVSCDARAGTEGEGEAGAEGGCLQASLLHNRRWRQLLYLEYVGVALSL